MEEVPVSCTRVTSSVASEQPSEASAPAESTSREEVKRMGVTVGQKAPISPHLTTTRASSPA